MLSIDFANSKLIDLVDKNSSPFSFLANCLSRDTGSVFNYISDCYDEAITNNSFTRDDDGFCFSIPEATIILVENDDRISTKPCYIKFVLSNPITEESESIDIPKDFSKETNLPPKPIFKENKYASAIYEFANLCGRNYLSDIAHLASPEKWSFGSKINDFEILENYIAYTFCKVQNEDKLMISVDQTFASFNTGLVDIHNDYIYMCFRKFPDEDEFRWKYSGVCTTSIGFCQKLLIINFSPLPQPATYITKLSDLYFDLTKPVFINTDHILRDRLHRLPTDFIASSIGSNKEVSEIIKRIERNCDDNNFDSFEKLKTLVTDSDDMYESLKTSFEQVVAKSVKKLIGNYHLAVPGFYPSCNTTNLLIPFDFGCDSTNKTALVIQMTASGNYFVYTILSNKQAYVDARLISKIENNWLSF